jgi:hypothetical protein
MASKANMVAGWYWSELGKREANASTPKRGRGSLKLKIRLDGCNS